MKSENGTCEDLAGGNNVENIISEPIQLMAITIKPTYKSYIKKIKLNKNILLEFFSEYCIRFNFKPIAHVLELDSLGVPHIHGTIEIPISIDNHKLPKNIFQKGYHIFITKIYNIDSWNNYINKQIPDHNQPEYLFI